ncbi:MAG: hypothetical protein ACU0GG_21655 [Paracoccaceae bacterium]
MIDILSEEEELPTAYPATPAGLSDAAAALDAGAIWQRIEAYCRFRWTERQAVWIVKGEGAWHPPLKPFVVHAPQYWNGEAFMPFLPRPTPLGGTMLEGGTYLFTVTLGPLDVPAAVNEAFKRLAEYFAQVDKEASNNPGVSSYSVSIDGAFSESFDRSGSWAAKGLQHSGAADLLRPYRRAK